MKKAFLIIAFFFAAASSNLALAGSQTYTSPWRKPYDEGESGFDHIDVNINSYCYLLQLSGTFYPSNSEPADNTYCHFSFYDSSDFGLIYSYLYDYNWYSSTSFSYTDSSYKYYNAVNAYANISNGSATYTVSWY